MISASSTDSFLTAVDAISLKLFSWNVLAQCLVRRDLFPYISSKSTTNPISLRKRLATFSRVFAEETDVDVWTLQEVDIDSMILSFLSSAGFDYVLTKRAKGGHGLAIAWKRERFECIQSREIALDDHKVIHPTIISPTTFIVGQIVVLRVKGLSPERGYIISNHHLFWR